MEERASGHIKRREKSRQIALKAKRETIDEMVATARSAEAAGLDRDRQIIASIQSQQQRMVAEASVQPARLIPAPPRSVASLQYEDNPSADRADSAAPPARPYMTDAQIDKIARQFLAKFPVGDDFDEVWSAYSRTLESAVPSQARAEIKERARVILGLHDSADTNLPPRSGA